MQDHVRLWLAQESSESCNVLLCGVTSEIVEMEWPPGARLWAVEKSRVMIEEVWPASGSETKLPLQAEWTSLPFAADSFDIVIGDGCLTSLEYPHQQRVFLDAIHTVLKPSGILIMRFFVQKDEPEQPDAVFSDLHDGLIGSFHVMKWRLAMSMQDSAREGVQVDRIWKAWKDAGISTDWPTTAVDTIETYRGSDHRLTFTNMHEIRELLSTQFEEQACRVSGYELGERCPILVYSPGKQTVREMDAS